MMAQPVQVLTSDANNDWVAIDNSAASTTTTVAGAGNQSPIGFDTPASNASEFGGAVAQATNPFADTGSTTLDSVNDTFYADPSNAMFPGNPVSAMAPTYAKVTTVLNTVSGQRLLWKNPA